MKLSEWEKTLLEYYLNNYNAKWIRVYNNKNPVIETRVMFYSVFKRKIKKQPYCGELTYIGMFRNLNEGDWYFIPNLLLSYEVKQSEENKGKE